MQLSELEQTKLNQVRLDQSWKEGLAEFLLSQQMDDLRSFLVAEKNANKIIYPPSSLIFNALDNAIESCKSGDFRTRSLSRS